jgi:membrane fusion protein (multidrug efflux system)
MKSFITAFTLFLLIGCSQPQATAPVAAVPTAEVLTITTGKATTERDYTASIQGKVDVEIRPQVEGFLEKVLVDEGQYVTAGQA